jgi:hypothetical protein
MREAVAFHLDGMRLEGLEPPPTYSAYIELPA